MYLRGTPLIGSLGTLGSTALRAFSDSLSFSAILSASLFMDLIFFLLNPALVLLDALVILSFKASFWDFRLSISFSKFLNFLASLESLFRLRLSCLFVKELLIRVVPVSCSGSQVDIRGAGAVCLCGGQLGSQVDICEGGGGGLWA